MKKNKAYFMRAAIVRTAISGCFYLALPVGAKLYHQYIGSEYWGYTAYGMGILLIANLVLLVRAWSFALSEVDRKAYLEEE